MNRHSIAHARGIKSVALRVVCVSLVWLAVVAPLGAQEQDELGQRASFTAGASFGDGETAPGLSAALGFRLAQRLGLEFELAHARKLDFLIDLCPPPLVCVRGGQFPVTGRSVSVVPHLVIELVPESRRIRVYAQAGVGAGHVRQRFFLGPAPANGVEEGELTRSNVVVALSFGGGAAVQLSRRLAVGADLRSLHLLDEEATPGQFITPSGVLSTLRVGSRVSWRF